MKTKNVIRNTSEEAMANPLSALATMGAFGGSGREIEASEARGQEELVRSEVLPSRMSFADRKALVASGVVFGDQVDGDLLFIHVTLPPGWEKRGTSHAMWSDLIDEKGRKRAAIFYKAAFYDRKAELRALCRHRIESVWPEAGSDLEKAFARRFHVMVDDQVLFDTGWHTPPADRNWETPGHDAATAWLNEHRPGWQDPARYWDEPTTTEPVGP